MGLNQTSLNDGTKVLKGSTRLEYSTDSGSTYTDLGILDSAVLTETITPLDGSPDNGTAPDILRGAAAQTIQVQANLWLWDLTKLQLLRGGIDTLTTTSGTPVASNVQTVTSGDWSFNSLILLEGQNADSTIPTINSVTGATDGALTLNTDYITYQDPNTSKWYIQILDSITVTTESQDVTINTDFTPGTVQKFTTGGKSSVTRRFLRITNYTDDVANASDALNFTGINEGDAIYRRRVWTIYYASINAGIAATFKSKDDTAPQVVLPIDMLGENDPSRTVGDQLYSIENDIVLQSAVSI